MSNAIEVLREHTPYDYLGPDRNDPVAGEKWGEVPEYIAAVDALEALVRAVENHIRPDVWIDGHPFHGTPVKPHHTPTTSEELVAALRRVREET